MQAKNLRPKADKHLRLAQRLYIKDRDRHVQFTPTFWVDGYVLLDTPPLFRTKPK